MAAGATKWAWENSRASNGSLIVLLAIADECGEGEFTEMSVAELARKARLSERGIQAAVRELVALGELSITLRPGRGRRNRYSPCTPNPAESAPFTETPQNLHPAESAPFTRHTRRSEPNPAESAPKEISDDLKGSVVSGKRSKPRRSSDAPRPDVDRLCEHLADRIEAHGSRRPAVNERWRNAARLMLDVDKRAEDDVHKAIDWCQQHHFWHRNILSMEKLRSQYDRLRLEAKAEREKHQRAPVSRQQETDDLFARAMERARQADAMEAAIDPRGNRSAGAIHQGRIASAGN